MITRRAALPFVGLALVCSALGAGQRAHTEERLAFTLDSTAVWIADGDGRHLRRVVTSRSVELRDPTWSPDGKRLAYADGIPGGPIAIYVVDADGRNRVRLTRERRGIERSPAWSPDGRTIAFVKGDPSRGIYLMDADGRRRRLLTKLTGEEPAWSPDGRKLIFSFGYAPKPFGIDVIDADGTHVRRLTTPQPSDESEDGYSYYYVSPAWSPNGKRIAFVEVDSYNGRGGGEVDSLHVIGADGKHALLLPADGDSDLVPTWAPDGRAIAFSTFGSIETIGPAGRHKRTLLKLRNHYAYDPAWWTNAR